VWGKKSSVLQKNPPGCSFNILGFEECGETPRGLEERGVYPKSSKKETLLKCTKFMPRIKTQKFGPGKKDFTKYPNKKKLGQTFSREELNRFKHFGGKEINQNHGSFHGIITQNILT